MRRTSKTDEFSEKFQTAFDPPPLIFGKLYCKFFKLATKPSKDGANRTAFLKMYLVLIFINTIVEKHNLKRPLCINFMVK